MTPDAFVWWLRGYLEATGVSPTGIPGAVSDIATVRDMLAHVPFEGASPTPLHPRCGCAEPR